MKGKKILTLILAVVLAAGMLTACVNVPGSRRRPDRGGGHGGRIPGLVQIERA